MIDAEMPSVFSDTVRKARHDHKCCECCQVIHAGEKYHLFKGCWEGRWEEFKTCMDCQDLREEVGRLYRSDEWPPFRALSEWALESGFEFPVSR